MLRPIIGAGLLAVLAACATQTPGPVASNDPDSKSRVGQTNVQKALTDYYAGFPDSALPVGPELQTVNASLPLTRIILASCNDEERDSPALRSIATEDADLMLFIGDNVYGDMDGRSYANYDLDLEELRESYADLSDAAGISGGGRKDADPAGLGRS